MPTHNSLLRVMHRAKEETYASALLAREFGVSEGVNAFRAKIDLQVMNRNGYRETPAMTDRLMRKHETVLRDVELLLGDYLDRQAHETRTIHPTITKDVIWTCWWQGEEQAPPLVKRCLESLRKNANGRELIVVTDRNVDNYVTIPLHMRQGLAEGHISRTHLSDYLRLALLVEYGGTWLDATFYCTAPLRWEAGASLFTIRRPGYGHGSVAAGRFAGYSLGCHEEFCPVFARARDALAEYWKHRDFLIDYLLIDYVLELLVRREAAFSEALERLPGNHPHCDDLFIHLGKAYRQEKWSALTRDTSLFKLSWKHTFPVEQNDVPTFFGVLLKGELR